jgi:hypothetical protein
MSLFGKILIVLNVLLVGGFFFVAALDYARREAWSDNYVQHDLLINGLPWDDKELDSRGSPRVESLRQPVVNKLQGGNGVKTQQEEFNAQKKKVMNLAEEVKQPTASKASARQLVRVLTSLADSQARREQLQNLAAHIDQAPDDKPYTAWFQLTAQSLAALKADQVPQPILDKLEKLKDQPPAADFAVEMSKVLPADEVQQVGAKVTERADLRPWLAAEAAQRFDRVTATPAKPETPEQTVQTLLEHRKLLFAELLFRLAEANRGFKLTDESFAALGKDGLPAGVVTKLAAVKDKAFDTEEAFLQDLAQTLTPEELKLHRAKLLSRGREPLTASKAYERFLAVAGMATAWRAVDHYATNLRQGEQEVLTRIEDERALFAQKYRARLVDIANLQNQLNALQATEAEVSALAADRDKVVKREEARRDELLGKLKEAKEEAAKLLKTQKFLEESLYKSRQELRDAFAENQKLEQTLRAYEQGR